MDCKEPKSKSERTTREQLECYIEYVKKHPQLLTGKNCPFEPQRIKVMWEEISSNLNSLRAPIRTPTKWKESLAKWKKQIRSRARKSKFELMRTGGGPQPCSLSDFENQALKVFGLAAVEGVSASVPGYNTKSCSASSSGLNNSDYQINGMPTCSNSQQNIEKTDLCNTVHANVIATEPNGYEINLDSLDSNRNTSTTNVPTSSSKKPPAKRRKTASQEIAKTVMDYIKKKELQDERFIQLESEMANALGKIGDGLLSLSDAIKQLKK